MDANIVLLSNFSADDFVDRTTLPIFRDEEASRPAWDMMEENARKHDTFVYSKDGERLLYWNSRENSVFDDSWPNDMRAIIEANQ